jgi:hypothetical protein
MEITVTYESNRLKRSHPETQPVGNNTSSSIESKDTQLDSSPQNDPTLSPTVRDDKTEDLSFQNGGWGTAGLQPASILSKEAQSGKFSLENILCVPDVLEPLHAKPLSRYGIMTSSRDDPIEFNILTFPVALGLFER